MIIRNVSTFLIGSDYPDSYELTQMCKQAYF